ncbi:MAG: hypothetical protein WCK89_06065 [bacterium]
MFPTKLSMKDETLATITQDAGLDSLADDKGDGDGRNTAHARPSSRDGDNEQPLSACRVAGGI